MSDQHFHVVVSLDDETSARLVRFAARIASTPEALAAILLTEALTRHAQGLPVVCPRYGRRHE